MKHTLVLLLLGCLCCGCGPTEADRPAPPGQTETIDPQADAAAVQQLIQDIFDNIWSGTDTSYVSRYHTEDFVLLEHGEVWTNDTIRNYQLRKAARADPDAARRLNSFDFYELEQHDDLIWVAYQNYGNWVKDGDTLNSRGWLESAVAERSGDGWKLRMMHSTRQ